MKFGKTLLNQQIPEYAANYINYKALKKLIKALETGSPRGPGFISTSTYPSKQSALQANKAAFFFRLERELEKVNSFYLQKESELKSRLKVLTDKKAIIRSQSGTISRKSAVLLSLQEGYQNFERDLSKLQQFIELNATGFAKALKKWDKRSKSQTKELYLSRQVEVQPVFNRDVIAALSDSAASSLLELEAWINGEEFIGARDAVGESNVPSVSQTTLTNLESDLIAGITHNNISSAAALVSQLSSYSEDERRATITTAFLRTISDGSIESLQFLLESGLVDTAHIDEITDRGCLHEAAIAGRLEVIEMCVDNGADVKQTDLHGRHALHYACRNGHEDIARYLLSKASPPDHLDQDGMTPMTMAVISGKANCVDQLLEFGASVDSLNESSIPLHLACQYGNKDIVRLLLLRKPKITSNSEGLLPLHLAARTGIEDILEMLMQYDKSGIDVQERFSLWTPLFFAASEGHDKCVQLLLRAGATVNTLDDNGHSAIYWSAWAGHLGCMNLLFEAGARQDQRSSIPSISKPAKPSGSVPTTSLDDLEIPTLSLPPPIIPSFGHNFLEKKVFVQFRLGGNSSNGSAADQPVLLYSDASLTSAKLTISPKGCDDIVPRSVLLPLTDDDQRSVSFYVDKIENFSLDFELYPTFGSKVIGKGSALGHVFSRMNKASQSTESGGVFCTLPIFDSRLKVIGEISFEFSIIKPFQGVQLEIGGKVETYWKSTRPLHLSSTGTPSSQSLTGGTSGQSLITASSLSGQFVRVYVQVTRDLVPVAYPSWRLPVEGLDLGVSEVTYRQFQAIINKHSHSTARTKELRSISSAQQAQNLVSLCFTSLADLLSSLPPTVHLNLQILYPTKSERDYLCIDFVPEINDYVDSILQAVFESAESSQAIETESLDGQQNRTLLFSSFNPDICTTINWKQPNYAVFFANYMGDSESPDRHPPSTDLGSFPASQPLAVSGMPDWRCRSIRDAVKFAKSNNILGLICQAKLLMKVPALIQSIKEGGLVLITYGLDNEVQECSKIQEGLIDGFMVNGVLAFSNAISV